MELFTLLFGKSKKKMRPIMIDEKHKVERYKKAREATKDSKAGQGWHEIIPAEKGAKPWSKGSATVGGYKDDGGRSGYIGKNGFNPHT